MTMAHPRDFDMAADGGYGELPPDIVCEDYTMVRGDLTGSTLLDEALATWWLWHDAAGAMPAWPVFKPFEHPRLLPNIMVFEAVGQRFRCSIVGETVVRRWPFKVANRFIDEVMPVACLEERTGWLTRTLSGGVPTFADKAEAWRVDDELIGYRALQLPFAGEAGKNPRVISLLDFRVEQSAS